MPHQATTLASWTGAIAEALEAEGIAYEPLFHQAELDPRILNDTGARVPVEKLAKLWQLSVEATGNPAFGLEVPHYRAVTTLHALGVTMEASSTIGEAIERMVRLCHVVSDAVEVRTREEDGDTLALEYYIPPDIRALVAHEDMDAFLAAFRQRLRPGDLKEVRFIRPTPADPEPWYRLFGCPVKFNSGEDTMLFSKATLERSWVTANPELARVNEEIALEYLRQFEGGNILTLVEKAIKDLLPLGEPKQSRVAEELNLSVRQLQRKLAAENTSFSTLLQQIRHQLAKSYLADGQRSIVETSLQLGFTDQSNFASAFKRWEGMSPTQYREKRLKPGC